MNKIKVNCHGPVVTGKQISFTAPCSSQNTECLVIEDIQYDILDANGVSVCGIENIWNANAFVSVILDTNNHTAFIQNANTNTYAEGQFQVQTQKLETSTTATIHDMIPIFSASEKTNTNIKLGTLKNILSTQFSSIYVTSSEGAEVVCTNGETTLTATCSSKGRVVFYVNNVGTWTITASLDNVTSSETVNVDSMGQEYNVTVLLVRELKNSTWEQIAKVSESGKASSSWQVGDEIDIVVNGETLTLVIVGFNHDNLTAGSGNAGITFGLKNLMAETRVIDSDNTNAGGFDNSELYAWLCNELLPALPSDLQKVIKYVDKYTSEGSKSSTIETNSCRLFLFSQVEVFGGYSQSYEGEGTQYDYFATSSSRVKYLSNGEGNIHTWALRSPSKNSDVSFCSVFHMAGVADCVSTNASDSYGICFGFCV